MNRFTNLWNCKQTQMFIFCLGKIRWPYLYQTRNGRFDLLVLLFYADHFHIYWATYLLIYSVLALFFCFVLFFICFDFFVFVFLKGLVLFSVRGELRSVQDLKQCSVIAAYRDNTKRIHCWKIIHCYLNTSAMLQPQKNIEIVESYVNEASPGAKQGINQTKNL